MRYQNGLKLELLYAFCSFYCLLVLEGDQHYIVSFEV